MTDLDRRLPPLATLVAFEAAHRLESFTRAATELHTSQATVSRRVRELERDLGIQLFERRRYDVAPTPAADALVASVRLSLGELASTAERLREDARGDRPLTILTSPSLAPTVLTPVLSRFQTIHPQLNLRVLSACEPIDATREHFDVALQYDHGPTERHRAAFIATEAAYPVCSPEYLDGLDGPVDAARLSELTLLHVDYGHDLWTTWSGFLERVGGTSPTGSAMTLTSYPLCLDVAEQGRGVALGWDRSVRPRLEAGTLVRLPGLELADAGRINAYLPHRRDPHPLGGEVVALLREVVAG